MLSIQNLSFSYGKQQLFSHLNLQLEPGLHWLSGANGCGKSSLLRILAALDKTQKGGISFNQHQVEFSWYSALRQLGLAVDFVSPEHDLTPYTNIIALRNKVAERQSVQIAMRDEGLFN